MVHRQPALRVLVPFEHREVDHPQWPPRVRDELQVRTELQTQGAERVADDLCRVCAEEDQVPVQRTRALEDARHRGI